MPRDFSTTFRASLESANNDDPAVVFLTFSHADWDDDLRFNWDVKDYFLDGLRYVGFPFALTLLRDSEEAPTGSLRIENVDRLIGEAVRTLSDSPTIDIAIYPASDFDLTVDPRQPLGTPSRQYHAAYLFLGEVEVDAVAIQAAIRSWDYVQEPWPSRRATPPLTPGLFW